MDQTSIVTIPDLPDAPTPLSPDQNPAAVYIATLTTDKSKRSMKCAIRQISRMLGHEEPTDVPWHMMRYQHVAALQAASLQVIIERKGGAFEPIAPSTVRLRMAALRGVLKQAWMLGLMNAEDYHRAISLKAAMGKRLPPGRALTLQELDAVYAVVERNTLRNARDALIISLCCFGLRRAEAMNLELADYDRNTGYLKFIGKGNKQREVHIGPDARASMERWLAHRGVDPGPLLLPIDVRGVAYMRRCCEKVIPTSLSAIARTAKIKPFTAHDLRRTFITRLLESGVDISLVGSVVGHDDPSTTKIYDRRGTAAIEAATEAYRLPFRSKE